MDLKLLSINEAADQARVTSRTMRRYIAENIGPRVTRVGGRVFIQEQHFRNWIRNGVSSQLPKETT
ncbi:MAG: helix-turn-helix domain-containing protein [Acetobacter aceti]|uniref:Helix-turn-helix domain-containing protein n=1 Tax=Acetobacter estunensis TaxID=104097 RepID=A0A967EDF8_9PROT|nr:helix-turn-helix domain-containing protein [Acetobacter estunensis]NHO54246.1 helix-turn-helix domain-containing protein [Acetobacter estunensis]